MAFEAVEELALSGFRFEEAAEPTPILPGWQGGDAGNPDREGFDELLADVDWLGSLRASLRRGLIAAGQGNELAPTLAPGGAAIVIDTGACLLDGRVHRALTTTSLAAPTPTGPADRWYWVYVTHTATGGVYSASLKTVQGIYPGDDTINADLTEPSWSGIAPALPLAVAWWDGSVWSQLLDVRAMGTPASERGSTNRAFHLGDDADEPVYFYARARTDRVQPYLVYVPDAGTPANGRWKFSHNGTDEFELGSGGGGMTGFTAAGDAGTPQSVGDAETLTFDGQNAIKVTAAATRQLLIELLIASGAPFTQTASGLALALKAGGGLSVVGGELQATGGAGNAYSTWYLTADVVPPAQTSATVDDQDTVKVTGEGGIEVELGTEAARLVELIVRLKLATLSGLQVNGDGELLLLLDGDSGLQQDGTTGALSAVVKALAAGDTIELTEASGTYTIAVLPAPTGGLESTASGLAVKCKPGGGLAVDAGGLYLGTGYTPTMGRLLVDGEGDDAEVQLKTLWTDLAADEDTSPGAAASNASAGSAGWIITGAPWEAPSIGPGADSEILLLTGWDLADVPDAAIIAGIKVSATIQHTGAAVVTDKMVKLYSGGAFVGESKAGATPWPSGVEVREYGAADDDWGLSLTGADVKDANFGVGIQVQADGADEAVVHSCAMMVFWLDPSTLGAYIIGVDGVTGELVIAEGETLSAGTPRVAISPDGVVSVPGQIDLNGAVRVQDAGNNHHATLAVADLAADRTVTLPDPGGDRNLGVTGPRATVWRSGAQTIAHNTVTAIDWASQGQTLDGITVGSPTSRLVVPTGGAGRYLITVQVTFTVNATGERGVFLKVGGSIIAQQYLAAHATQHTTFFLMAVRELNDTNYITVEVDQRSGGDLNLVAGADRTVVTMTRLGIW